MSNRVQAISINSNYGIKPVQVDGVTVATILKFAVKRNSLLHIAYWAAFWMHDFGSRPRLTLYEQDVCKNKSNIRLYCMALSGQQLDLSQIYRRAQVLVREAEIAELQGQMAPEWVSMFWELKNQALLFNDQDELPF
jgi:hypothetical protein